MTDTASRENFILMTVGGLTLDPVTKTPIVILRDPDNKLNLPIWIGLLEATNLSVGRGTDTPFEMIGAPWIEPTSLADALNKLKLPGIRFDPVRFTPTENVYARSNCGGVRFVVTDRDHVRPVTVALAVANTLRERYRAQWAAEKVQNLLVNRHTIWALLRGEPLPRLIAWSEEDRSAFLKRRASYLIYR